MDIMKPHTFSFVAPTTRTDGTPIKGTLSYLIEIEGASGLDTFETASTKLTIDFFAEGYAPGNYTAYARAIETTDAVGRMSARSAAVPFSLEQVANPNPPASLSVV